MKILKLYPKGTEFTAKCATLGLLIAINCSSSFAIPALPTGCHSELEPAICKESTVTSFLKGSVQTSLFAFVAKESFDIDEIEEIFFDFESWPDYAEQASDSGAIRIHVSSLIDNPDEKTLVHYSHYTSRAPDFPLGGKQVVRAVNRYTITREPGVLLAANFEVETDPAVVFNNLPYNEAPLKGAENVKSQRGFVKVYDYNDEFFLISFRAETRPGIDILPEVAKVFIEDAYYALLEGMYFNDLDPDDLGAL